MKRREEMFRKALVLAALLGASAPAMAVPAVDAGTSYLRPNRADQEIHIYVTGGDAVEGLEFMAELPDANAPTIQDANVLDGTIFAGNNLGLFGGSYIDPRRLYLGVVTETGTVAADGLLASVVLDASGIHEGSFALSLTNALEGPTNFAGDPADLTDGWIEIVRGDFNGTGQRDANDIDMLFAARGSDDMTYDLDGNLSVNDADVAYWLEDLVGTHYGDADLDGDVDIVEFVGDGNSDLNILLSMVGTGDQWGEGDFDGDADVDIVEFIGDGNSDLNILLTNAGATCGDLGGRVRQTAPEPGAMAMAAAGACLLLRRRKRRRASDPGPRPRPHDGGSQ
jgi:hypothetical protein